MALRQKLDSTQKMYEQAEKNVADMAAVLDVRTKQNDKLVVRLDQLQNDRSSIQMFSDSAKTELAKSKAELESANARNRELEVAVTATHVKLNAALQDASMGSDVQNQQVSQLQGQVSAMQQQLAAESADRVSAQEQAKKLNDFLTAAQQRLASNNSVLTKREEPAAIASLSNVSMTGASVNDAMTVMSSGMNVAFSGAIKLIVPQGWMVITATDVGNLPVDWNGAGRVWTSVLDEMLKSQNLKATVDSGAKEITIRR
jgi:chromosome segregation ATPase